MIRRRAAADRQDKAASARPASTRAAGAGGSSASMLRLYTDESPGLKVDPVVVMTLSVVFIISVVLLHGEFALLCLVRERRCGANECDSAGEGYEEILIGVRCGRKLTSTPAIKKNS